MSVFLNINSKFIADSILSAKSKVIYASPGLDETVASAIVEKINDIGSNKVKILLDVSENVFRYGYGTIEGLKILNKNGIPINDATGIRIGALVYDSDGVIFSPTPLLIEAGKHEQSMPNAMTATSGQVVDILSAISPEDTDNNSIDTGNINSGIDSTEVKSKRSSKPEIGVEIVSEAQIEKASNAIDENPPQKFDVARKVQVFSSAIEFVEMELKGCEIQRHTVSIPSDLLVGNIDKATRKRLSAKYNIINKNSKLSGATVRNEVNEIKKTYTKSILKYGNVLLKTKKKEFDEAIVILKESIETFQKEVQNNLKDEISKTKSNLMEVLFPAVKTNPPKDLIGQIQGDEATDDQVKKYIDLRLAEIFPTAENIIKAMSFEYIIKAVSYETILDEEFQIRIKNAYPLINWDEMFEEYDAARESE